MKLVLAKFDSGLNDWLLRELMNGKVDDVGDCEQQRTKKRRYNNTPLLMRSAQGMAAEEDIVHSTDGSYCTSTIPVQSEDSHEVSPAFDIIIVNPDSSTEVSGDASAGCDSHERDAYPHSVDHHCLDSHTNSVYSDNSRVDRVTRQNEENPCCDEDSAVAGEAETKTHNVSLCQPMTPKLFFEKYCGMDGTPVESSANAYETPVTSPSPRPRSLSCDARDLETTSENDMDSVFLWESDETSSTCTCWRHVDSTDVPLNCCDLQSTRLSKVALKNMKFVKQVMY
eukprot:Lankesteria_metandrocarpae@DN3407_c0_g1_i1.p1